ncbi:CPBP family intramembrane glutamic endopeptidase [Spongiactinospora sp. TRM90649]|uniref:CPBP family intramembrane glutamic endopeptidase n=1 Tax=Spongiactinospora sp. TRM90649 TaxID=3031114 RepID=UPI0023F90697|nr:CPBP family intramembrane glutamic endopeptidase [Spongiactinospora sp. TRM90649]MDF5752426.1 CPBP family intramembrane metalloprotease [Spongiactinospora sp. TRM90649]
MSTKNRGIAAFLIICFGATWAYIFGARYLLDLSLVNPLVQLPMGFFPAIAAIIVRRWVTREGFRDAGLALRLRAGWPYYLAAWAGPLLLVMATAGLAAALGLWRPDLSPLNTMVAGLPAWASLSLLMAVVVLLIPVYWGEEFGWTSYLRLRVFTDRPLLSVTVTGLIWAVWHYPLAFVGYIEFGNIPLGLFVWTISFLFQEIILAWLRLRSGTIWAASLAHAGNNMVLFLLTGMLLYNIDINTVTLLVTAPLAALSAWIILSGQFKRYTSPTSEDRPLVPEPTSDRSRPSISGGV